MLSLLFYIVTAVVTLAIGGYLIIKMISNDFQWIYLLFTLLLLLTSAIQTIKAYASIKTPTKNILVWNKNEDYLVLRNLENTHKIKLDALNVIEYQLQSDTVKMLDKRIKRSWINVDLVLKGGNKEHLFVVNLVRAIKHPHNENELVSSAKELTTTIAKHLHIEARKKSKVIVE